MIKNISALVLVRDDAYWSPYVLESIRLFFPKVVMYNCYSQDGSKDIFEHYKKKFEKDGTEVVLEHFPDMEPRAQIALRNSMIAEAGTEYYMLIDGDEIYPRYSLTQLMNQWMDYQVSGKIYGIVNRTEVCADLQTAYSPNTYTNHHRVYDRIATWCGTHPGEYARIKQKPANEYKFSQDVEVFHFHNAIRSPLEHTVPSRMNRKSKPTYTSGSIEAFNLFEKLPILKTPIENFVVNPVLAALQRKL